SSPRQKGLAMRDARKALWCGVGLGVGLSVVASLTLGRALAFRNPPGEAPDPPDVPLVPLPSLRADPPPAPPPPPASSTPPPAPPPGAPAEGTSPRELYQKAAARYANIDSYIARLTRREVVKDRPQPEAVMLFKFRKEPWSVYFKWLGKEGQGREVVYVRGE